MEKTGNLEKCVINMIKVPEKCVDMSEKQLEKCEILSDEAAKVIARLEPNSSQNSQIVHRER